MVEDLAAQIARDIFLAGDEPGVKCRRIQFKSGTWPDNEHDIGGLIEPALAKVVEKSLSRMVPHGLPFSTADVERLREFLGVNAGDISDDVWQGMDYRTRRLYVCDLLAVAK